MSKYGHILLAVELDTKGDSHLVKKGLEIRDQYGAELTLIHVVEHLSNYGAAYGVSAGVDVEEILVKEAEESIAKLGGSVGVDKDHCLVKVGPTSQTIVEEAQKRKVDLILVGSHGRSGVRLLLGSTANGVLHEAHCDVLAVRLRDS